MSTYAGHYVDELEDRTGRKRTGLVEVRAVGSALLASLWADPDRTTVAANPVVVSADGVVDFHADPGEYNLTLPDGTVDRRPVPTDPREPAAVVTALLAGKQPLNLPPGLLSARPAAVSVPVRSRYRATDLNGGTEYETDGATWDQVAPGVLELGGQVTSGPVIYKGGQAFTGSTTGVNPALIPNAPDATPFPKLTAYAPGDRDGLIELHIGTATITGAIGGICTLFIVNDAGTVMDPGGRVWPSAFTASAQILGGLLLIARIPAGTASSDYRVFHRLQSGATQIVIATAASTVNGYGVMMLARRA